MRKCKYCGKIITDAMNKSKYKLYEICTCGGKESHQRRLR